LFCHGCLCNTKVHKLGGLASLDGRTSQ
jgi:hypothetical protein